MVACVVVAAEFEAGLHMIPASVLIVPSTLQGDCSGPVVRWSRLSHRPDLSLAERMAEKRMKIERAERTSHPENVRGERDIGRSS
jgi:hypothetical protein